MRQVLLRQRTVYENFKINQFPHNTTRFGTELLQISLAWNSFTKQIVNGTELAYVVDEEFRETLQDAGVETVIVDNDRKAHSKIVRDAWARFGIEVWPGAGVVGDRTLVSEFTGEAAEKLGGGEVPG